jgi:hypothetical protein
MSNILLFYFYFWLLLRGEGCIKFAHVLLYVCPMFDFNTREFLSQHHLKFVTRSETMEGVVLWDKFLDNFVIPQYN